MIEETVEIGMSAATADGVFYRPQGDGRWPGVIYYTDIGGIRAAFQEMARRLAEKGYTVLMPNVFYRTGKPPLFDFPFKMGEERSMKRLADLSTPSAPQAMSSDASDYVDFLARQASVRSDRMGVVGHCFTGKMALYTAVSRPDKIAAAASFHGGGLATDAPDSPHRVLGLPIPARLYFGHATNDESSPRRPSKGLTPLSRPGAASI